MNPSPQEAANTTSSISDIYYQNIFNIKNYNTKK